MRPSPQPSTNGRGSGLAETIFFLTSRQQREARRGDRFADAFYVLRRQRLKGRSHGRAREAPARGERLFLDDPMLHERGLVVDRIRERPYFIEELRCLLHLARVRQLVELG